MREVFQVLRAGPQLTVQDLGRFGYLQYGVPPGGVLDDYSARLANILVGNDPNQALLEITFQGPKLKILGEAKLALTGAEMPLTLNGAPIPGWSSFAVKPGDILNIGAAKKGLRAYLAVSGGIEVPPVMGSRSTYALAGLGGYRGRALTEGDIIARGEIVGRPPLATCPLELIPQFGAETSLRAIPGPQDHMFGEGLETFFRSSFTVTSDSNRMGYRLIGPGIYPLPGMPPSIVSEPNLPGSVQLPPDGQPIIVLLEQATGGYAKIATVISVDISRIAQVRPGDRISFERVTLEEAHGLLGEREGLIKKMVGK